MGPTKPTQAVTFSADGVGGSPGGGVVQWGGVQWSVPLPTRAAWGRLAVGPCRGGDRGRGEGGIGIPCPTPSLRTPQDLGTVAASPSAGGPTGPSAPPPPPKRVGLGVWRGGGHRGPRDPQSNHRPSPAMHWNGGSPPPPPQGAQPMPSHCPPDGLCQRQWHL